MATLKDFVVNRGLVVNTAAVVNGVDVLANDYATYTTLLGMINTVQDNVGGGATAAFANDYNTYTTLVGEYQANDWATLLSARANDYATYLSLSANDGATLNSARANDLATYLTVTANTFNTYTTLVGEYQANDWATLTAARANDWNTYSTLLGGYQANDVATLNQARANDWATYSTLLSGYQANDVSTLNAARANDWATYSTLVNEYQANDWATYNTLLSGYRANDYATWSGLTSYINVKANSSITISAGDGLTGGGDLSANRTLAVDSTVVRTSGAQNIGGLKTFTDSVIISGDLTIEGNTTTIGTTSLLVEDKFIELAANTTGTPVGDVGIYLNRGNQGNSAIYYDQSAGYFALVNSNDPTTNTEVSPTSYAALRVGTILVSNTAVVTNLNADLLDGQQGSYYVDFANATNTNLITLARVTANGATTPDSITVGGLTVDANTFHVDTTNNFVGVRTLSPRAPLQVEDVAFDTSVLVTSATTANQVLDSFAAATFRTAKYLVQVHATSAADYHTSEILLIHDGTNVYMTEYAIVYTDNTLATFNADISGGNVRLLVTPTNAVNTIRVVRQALLV